MKKYTSRYLRKRASELGIKKYGSYKVAELKELVLAAEAALETPTVEETAEPTVEPTPTPEPMTVEAPEPEKFASRVDALRSMVAEGFTPVSETVLRRDRTKEVVCIVEAGGEFTIKPVESRPTNPFVRVLNPRKKRIFGGWTRFDSVKYNDKYLVGGIFVKRANGKLVEETVCGEHRMEGKHYDWLLAMNEERRKAAA